MRTSKPFPTVLIVSVIALIGAASASGAAKTSSKEWYTGSPLGTTLVGDQALTATTPTAGKWVVKTTIGGKAVEFTATGMECISCTITNAEVTGKAGKIAMTKGKIKWTGVTVDKPVACILRDGPGGPVGQYTSKDAVIHDDWMNEAETIAYQQIFPESGEVLASFYLEGGECEAIQGSYNMTGTLFGQMTNATGVQAASQEVSFSPAIQTATGAALKIGSNAAELSGAAVFSIGGSAFGIH